MLKGTMDLIDNKATIKEESIEISISSENLLIHDEEEISIKRNVKEEAEIPSTPDPLNFYSTYEEPCIEILEKPTTFSKNASGNNEQVKNPIFMSHKREKEPVILEDPLKVLETGQQNFEKTTVHQLQFPCSECHKSFNKPFELKVHERLHTGEKPFKCEVCLKAFPSNSQLRSHAKIHSDEFTFKCGYCPKSFKLSCSVRRHEKTHIHSDENRPLTCEFCSKGFNRKDAFKMHMKCHDKETPICKYCHKSFPTLKELCSHRKSHENEEKPYMCKFCDKKFSLIAQMKIHSLVHTNERRHECKVCNQRFKTASARITHERMVHEKNAKNYSCDLCDKSYFRKGDLTRHKQQHAFMSDKECNGKSKGAKRNSSKTEKKKVNMRRDQTEKSSKFVEIFIC